MPLQDEECWYLCFRSIARYRPYNLDALGTGWLSRSQQVSGDAKEGAGDLPHDLFPRCIYTTFGC